MDFLQLILPIYLIVSYLIGSLNTAIILFLLKKIPDPRETGSYNPGATNVLRIAGKRYAAAVLMLDATKGFIPVFIAKIFVFSSSQLVWIGFAAILGHMYPCFFHWRGGKGVATTMGVLFALSWKLGLVSVISWIAVIAISGYASLASLVSMLVALLTSYVWIDDRLTLPLFLISALVIWRHRGNIVNLYQGTEHNSVWHKINKMR